MICGIASPGSKCARGADGNPVVNRADNPKVNTVNKPQKIPGELVQALDHGALNPGAVCACVRRVRQQAGAQRAGLIAAYYLAGLAALAPRLCVRRACVRRTYLPPTYPANKKPPGCGGVRTYLPTELVPVPVIRPNFISSARLVLAVIPHR